jgi:hypothetical protein
LNGKKVRARKEASREIGGNDAECFAAIKGKNSIGSRSSRVGKNFLKDSVINLCPY